MDAPSRYDAIVIGAGFSGLAAGIRLAQFDQRVVVLERHALWGGLNSYYKQAGRRFDVGLHAMTNFVRKGTPGAPLTRILRQLRIGHEELGLAEQSFSEIHLPGLRLGFSNDFELFRSEVARAFPAQRGAFDRLVRDLAGYDQAFADRAGVSSRAVLADLLPDPVLADALLLPICYYGSAREGDVDWDQFAVLFRSIFLEGFSRPDGGVRRILDLLVGRFRELGGELRLRAGVQRVVLDEARGAPHATGVVLDDGSELEADCILSSAGWAETMRLSGRDVPAADVGRLSFLETLSVLSRQPAAFGCEATIVFFSDAERFTYAEPDGAVDVRSGVVACPGNYRSSALPPASAPQEEGLLRATCLASYPRWSALDGEAYATAKRRASDELLDAVARHAFDPRPHTVHFDAFTPRTIHHYTGHLNGAVYGSPRKHKDGETGIAGLHLCGTDQGLCGIVGAMLSGITMANRHALLPRHAS